MSIGSVVDADYSTVIEYLRESLRAGTDLSAYQKRFTLNVLKDSVARTNTANAAIAAVVADIEVLDAAACAANAGADAAAVIATAVTDLEAAAVTAPTYTTNAVMDGASS